MAYDWLKGVADEYEVIVIGSGLGGLTGANVLAKAGHRVLLLAAHLTGGLRLLALEFLPWRDWQKTLLAIAAGLLPPDRGSVLAGGQIGRASCRERV